MEAFNITEYEYEQKIKKTEYEYEEKIINKLEELNKIKYIKTLKKEYIINNMNELFLMMRRIKKDELPFSPGSCPHFDYGFPSCLYKYDSFYKNYMEENQQKIKKLMIHLIKRVDRWFKKNTPEKKYIHPAEFLNNYDYAY